MNLRKKEYLRQSINNMFAGRAARAEKGQIGWVVGPFAILFLSIFLYASLQIESYRAAALYLEDALAASNLASAVIDVKEYGFSHKILIEDPVDAYERYKWAVKGNLNLTEGWEAQAGSLIQGAVHIVDYTIYNVDDSVVSVYHFDEDGMMTSWQLSPGGAVAPNGTRIVSTSIYSEIAFTVKGMLGMESEAHKGNLADIAR